jgi:hypothetical protein
MFGSLAIARTQSTKPRIRTMSFSMSKASLPVFEISLNALSAILDKADAHAAAKKIDPSVLLHSRLWNCLPGKSQLSSSRMLGTA